MKVYKLIEKLKKFSSMDDVFVYGEFCEDIELGCAERKEPTEFFSADGELTIS